MRTCVIHFSPTGGTLRVLELLARELPSPRFLDLTDRRQAWSRFRFGPEDLCLVGVPSFGGRAPALAMERLGLLRAEGAAAIPVCVYGNRAYEDTLLELAQGLERVGFRVTGAVAAVAEHSIMRQFASGRPDPADQAELASFSRRLWEAASSHGTVAVPGSVPYKPSHGSALHPRATAACIRCGLCAERCPAGAIPRDDPAGLDEALCIGCMRCVSLCPQQARQADPAMVEALTSRLSPLCSGRKENQLFLPE